MIQDPTKIPQALDIIDPMENVVAQPEIQQPINTIASASQMAAEKIYGTKEQRQDSIRSMGTEFLNNKIA